MCLKELLIGPDATVRDALLVIDMHEISEVLVTDTRNKLLGAVSENDLRRSLLQGANLGDPVSDLIRPPMMTVGSKSGRAEVLDLMRALGLRQVPILDDEGHVEGLHIENRVLGVRKRPNWAIIMAGGKGTRLGPLTKTIPKPMLPVAGRPILERLVLHLVGAGIERIFLSVNYLASIVEKHFGDGSQFGCSIEYLREDPDVPLGTGGALRLLGELGYAPAEPLLLMNGDLITGFSVDGLLNAHADSGAVATIATSTYEHQIPFGVTECDGNELVRIVEKPTPTWEVNAGIYVIDPALLSRVPHGQLYPITELFVDCISRGERVCSWSLRDDWQDIGRPDELARARGQA
ncbi:nucleotidyltransferase family protein [Amycolatopsis tucumanensis]|uniref:Nucleotidyltransferase family protein n=1 Tax=Amycolatopsis tucumanensis TaxID=401106 RepID=A0ABP7I6Z2_9PSEU|nr:nucleotidyltransferase family protein [Amycolatopsis tucumanensis]MCF6426207.1 nucleotidyltransferase family protein [Amycolatopsis tucumanensis]